MTDVRMLTLFKQHFLNEYPGKINCQYTCIGPYDGLDIEKIECENNSKLFQKRSNAVISDIWYETGNKVRKLKGEFGGQSIGIFRDDIYDEDIKRAEDFRGAFKRNRRTCRFRFF